MTIVKYLNPRNDIAFKKIFGTEKNKDILVHFLNDVIVTGNKNNRTPIKDVMLLNPMQYPELAHKKQSVLDVLCEDECGTQYIVEMQVAKVAGFEKRAQYYAARAYSSQPNKGDIYKHLKEVIFLAITEYEMFPKKTGYKSVHVILDQDSYERDLKDFSFTFLELPKFNKENINDLRTYEEKWCYFFKHAHEADDIGKILANSDEVIKRAYNALETHNWTNEELKVYEASEKIENDNKAREEYIREEAEAIGKAKGRAIGEAKGRAEERLEIAKQMLLQNIDIVTICNITGLSKEAVEDLTKRSKNE